jgi:hypothetical protein
MKITITIEVDDVVREGLKGEESAPGGKREA